jgi:O-antigen ligase
LPGKIAIISLVVCAAICVSPFLYIPFFLSKHDSQRIIEATCLSALILIMLWRFFKKNTVDIKFNKKVFVFLLGFFFLGYISSAFSFSPRYAFCEWASFLLLLLLAHAVAQEVNEKIERLRFLVLLCGASCALYLFNEMLVYVSFLLLRIEPDLTELIFGFDNYRFFNHIQTVSLPLLGLLVYQSRQFRMQYWFWYGITSLWWTLLFISVGRGTFVSIAAGTAITLILRRKAALPWSRIMLRSFFAGVLGYLIFYVLVPQWRGLQPWGLAQEVVQRTINSPASGREVLWRLAFELAMQHPLLGVGPLHFAHYGATLGTAAHPHNWVLQIASEWGFPALTCLILGLALAYRELIGIGQTIECADLNGQATLSAFLAAGAAILIDGLVSGLIVMPTSQLWIALYIGCCWGWITSVSRASLARRAEQLPSRQMRGVTIVAACALLVLFWNGLFPEMMNLKEREDLIAKISSYSFSGRCPRIWRAGFF